MLHPPSCIYLASWQKQEGIYIYLTFWFDSRKQTEQDEIYLMWFVLDILYWVYHKDKCAILSL